MQNWDVLILMHTAVIKKFGGVAMRRKDKVIKEALAEIERMKTEILNLQGAAECPNCGARMPQGASFCSSCGTKMAEPEHFTGEVVDDEKFDE